MPEIYVKPKLYAPVDAKTKKVARFYVPVSNKVERCGKLYASVEGKTRLVSRFITPPHLNLLFQWLDSITTKA